MSGLCEEELGVGQVNRLRCAAGLLPAFLILSYRPPATWQQTRERREYCSLHLVSSIFHNN